MTANQKAKSLAKIVSTLNGISACICGNNPLDQACGRAQIKILSQMPLYYDANTFIRGEEAEAKYLEKMRGLENLLIENVRNPNPEIKNELGNLCIWMRDINITPNKYYYTPSFANFVDTNRHFNIHNPLLILKCVYDTIRMILTSPSGDVRIMLVAAFDKYMCNLAIVGRSGYFKYVHPSTKPKTLRIPEGDEYYCKSIIHPKFDLTRFLIQGPHSIFYTIRDRFYTLNNVLNILNHDHDVLTSKYHYFPSGYTYVLEKFHKWNKLDDSQKKENFKLMFPEPVDIIDMFSIPF